MSAVRGVRAAWYVASVGRTPAEINRDTAEQLIANGRA
jgi:hypothetical protein